ncbi:3alpha(or 20beta)-hydroxysteroid dehydrogenase [Ochrobactrum daejeonense]|uniref:3alpha(Or 20beta)-hydroxysteroid dehydrogenase n=1 Tax=Brucella daejeonensis TaxID=659015 RepID=A0A7W9B1G2_9HYPH|nr:SDR family oxidoreductase [Brucella daejeonensis]MBB5704493.1 3alpha(or 20beta)-hydroxysteroid dehydrogenase [Brucella daejeonensis]
MRLQNKVALVTGASRGIGEGVVERFAEEGAIVYACSRTGSAPKSSHIIPIAMDVASETDWGRVVTTILREQGRIDILVNNAGVIQYDAVDELSLDAWMKVVAVNQTGVFLGMREVAPAMRNAGSGSIVNVSSIWGNAAVAGAHAYHATKGAVRNMSKNAALTYVKDGIRVNSLHPGFIDTPLTQSQARNVNDYVVASTPMQRPGTPREIANGALFLASDESSFMTGAELVIDGGYLAQ